jgi:hypothetical protein
VIGAGIFLSAFFLFHRYVPIGTSVSGTLFFFIGWTVIFFALLLIALIDIRIQIIPDELVVLIGALGLFLPPPAFIGPFAFLLGGGDLSLWMVQLILRSVDLSLMLLFVTKLHQVETVKILVFRMLI